MKKPDPSGLYGPHLALREFPVPPGGEWLPGLPGWSVIQVGTGTGYFLRAPASHELEAGTVLLLGGPAQGNIRASQLNGLSLCCFNVVPARLTGLITLGELDFLRKESLQSEFSIRIFPAHHAVAVRMRELHAARKGNSLSFRLSLLQLFVEIFGTEMERTGFDCPATDATGRLRVFLKVTSPDELLEMSFSELAQVTRCTSRHLSRVFYELVGMSFRDKRAEIRLARARDLLATSKSKVVEVALESGYKSLSLFNLMFARRFGTSPGRWRQKHGNGSPTPGKLLGLRGNSPPR